MPTPHISAQPGEIAPLLLMPGDPRRAARIAETFLTDAKLVSEVRGNGCFTGTYQGTPMSVMASGMGIPTLSIYATELYRDYGVQRICRVGTCGGISSKVRVRDVVIGSSAHTNSPVATIDAPGLTLSLAASFDMLRAAVDAARSADDLAGASVHVGPVYSSDLFYSGRTDIIRALDRLGTLGVEMEAAGLYKCALEHDREALTVLTVSDHLKDGSGDMSPEERETRFGSALAIAAAGLLA
ncbi:purine-nucleoside phosphorylase [Aestuariimicrobium kwangyangense]|uniref:purine-nucleoside phosphorylase n=1 Tax=Aestuariimicrobium kwangyangense TaxID=396389 RepID=UPI0003B71764|nr:purine-nucleoside phosphorylase [Aestuariimicrobium kwangyangense]